MPRVYLEPLEAHFYRNDITLIHQTVDTARDGGRHSRTLKVSAKLSKGLGPEEGFYRQVCCSPATVWNADELLSNCCSKLANSTCHRGFISDKSHSANDCDWNDAIGPATEDVEEDESGRVCFQGEPHQQGSLLDSDHGCGIDGDSPTPRSASCTS